MTEKRPLFRPEAVEFHAKARSIHRTLDLKERRTIWLFRGVLVAIAAVVGLAFVVPAETTAHGTAVVAANGTEAGVVLADLRRIEVGQEVTLEVGGTKVAGRVTSVDPKADLAVDFPVRVSLAQRATPRAEAKAAIELGRTSVAKLLMGKD